MEPKGDLTTAFLRTFEDYSFREYGTGRTATVLSTRHGAKKATAPVGRCRGEIAGKLFIK